MSMEEPQIYCLGNEAHAEKPYHYKECGLDNIFLYNGYEIEDYDGEQYASFENVDALWKAIGLQIVGKKKILSPKEIRFLRNVMRLTQAELASRLRVDDQTVARWEKKQAKLPGPGDVALRCLFLASDVAQPEGWRFLRKIEERLKELTETDQNCDIMFYFSTSATGWESGNRQRAAV